MSLFDDILKQETLQAIQAQRSELGYSQQQTVQYRERVLKAMESTLQDLLNDRDMQRALSNYQHFVVANSRYGYGRDSQALPFVSWTDVKVPGVLGGEFVIAPVVNVPVTYAAKVLNPQNGRLEDVSRAHVHMQIAINKVGDLLITELVPIIVPRDDMEKGPEQFSWRLLKFSNHPMFLQFIAQQIAYGNMDSFLFYGDPVFL